MMVKSLFSALALLLTLAAFIPYIRSIVRSHIRPHVFSWIIWGSTTLIVFFAQLAAHAGIGAWPIGVSGCLSIIVATLAFIKRGDIEITRSDYVFFISALASIPLWVVTDDPTSAVVVLPVTDLLGFGPTIRKAFVDPRSESLMFFLLFAARNYLVVLALQHYSLATVLFPATIGTTCVILIVMISYRRRVLYS